MWYAPHTYIPRDSESDLSHRQSRKIRANNLPITINSVFGLQRARTLDLADRSRAWPQRYLPSSWTLTF